MQGRRVKFVEGSAEAIGPILACSAEEERLRCAAAAIGSASRRILQGASFEEFEDNEAAMETDAMDDGLEASQMERLRGTGVVKIGSETLGELSGERLVFGKLAAYGERVSYHNACRIVRRWRRRIVETIGVSGEIDGVIVTEGREIADSGDAAVGIIAVVVFGWNERADGVGIVAEHGFPGAEGERVKRNKTEHEIQKEKEKHEAGQEAADAPCSAGICGAVVHTRYSSLSKIR